MPLSANRSVRTAGIGISKTYDFILHNGSICHEFEPGNVIGPLIRTFYLIRYCVSGRGKLVFDYGTLDISAGQCFAILPGQIVTEIADEKDPWVLTWLTVHGIRAGALFKSVGITSKNALFPWSEAPEISEAFNRAVNACIGFSEESEHFRTAHAYLLFDALTNYLRRNFPSDSAERQSDSYIKKAIHFMDLNYTEPIKVSDVAAYVGLNRSYFFTIFKNQVHISPQDYLTRLRMQKACEQLSYPGSSVATVANSLNYEPSVFFRHFKRVIGCSPSEYKKRLIEETRDS